MNNVATLKDAINVTLDKTGSNHFDLNLVQKLIEAALIGNTNFFTRSNGAREYVEGKILENNNAILNEIVTTSNSSSNDINQIISDYSNKFFVHKNILPLKNIIKEKSNFTKVVKRLKRISTESIDDNDFINKAWENFCDIFKGNDKTISKDEIRYDMLEAALEKIDNNRCDAQVLRNVNLNSKELNLNEAIYLVEENIYNNNLENIINSMDHNQIFSGLLLQNLLDYTYFNKEQLKDNTTIHEVDNFIGNLSITNKQKAQYLKDVIDGRATLKNVDKDKLVIELLKNSLCLYMYTNEKQSLDYNERRLYAGNNNLDENTIQNRIKQNNKIISNFIYDGNDINNVLNNIQNLSDIDIHFLTNIFVISRSKKENKKILEDQKTTCKVKEEIILLGILEKPELQEKLKETKQNVR